jgi:hypothetical protein
MKHPGLFWSTVLNVIGLSLGALYAAYLSHDFILAFTFLFSAVQMVLLLNTLE